MDKGLRPFVAEMIGTFCFVFLSAALVCSNALAAIAWPPTPLSPAQFTVIQPEPGLLGIAIGSGLIYAACLAVTLSFARGYLNPALPLALWVQKRMEAIEAGAYIFAQLVGAIAAGGAVRWIYGFNETAMKAARLGTPYLNTRIFQRETMGLGMLASGIGLEMALTFVLTFAIFAMLIDRRMADRLGSQRWPCVWVGVVLAACTLVGFNVTGAAMNPARWLGPALWQSTVSSLQTQSAFQDHVVYWFGPAAGALIAAMLYSALILPDEEGAANATPGTR
jgi:glycerol uptake facilitator-like aquaporin